MTVNLTLRNVKGSALTHSEMDSNFTSIKAELDGLNALNGDTLVGGIKASDLARKYRDLVNVKDFGAKGDGVNDDTIAIQSAINNSNTIYLPKGTYLISRALRLNVAGEGKLLVGDGKFATVIKRLDTTTETIDGKQIKAIIYTNYGDHHISGMKITGADLPSTTNYPLDGIHCPTFYRGNISNVIISEVGRGLVGENIWMSTFQNVLVRDASNTAFDFSSADGKTSLNFVNCLCENVGNAFLITNAFYSTMQSCGADYVNYTATGNPYGRGYGSRSSAKGIYHIKGSDVVMNGCGAENCYGDGFLNLDRDTASTVTLNNCTTFGAVNGVRSEYIPLVGYGVGYAVGCIQTGTGTCSVTINGGRFDYANPVAPVVADLVAFNYSEGDYGVRNNTMVTITGTVIPSNLSNPFAGRGDYTFYCKSSTTTENTYTLKLTGNGNKIIIPITSQSNTTHRHMIKVSAIDMTGNSASVVATETSVSLASLNTIAAIDSWNNKNVVSVTADNMNLVINLTTSLNNPIIKINYISSNPQLLNIKNITVAT